MCLVTTPSKRDRTIRREEYYEAPRPVSNYHGGPAYGRTSRSYSRTRRSSVPVERVSYRSSYRTSQPRVEYYEPRRSGNVDVIRTSRTYVR